MRCDWNRSRASPTSTRKEGRRRENRTDEGHAGAGEDLATQQRGSTEQEDRPETCRAVQRGDAERSLRLTSQGLSISPDGRIVDGQHRLAAVVAYGEPVEFVVDLDADPSSFDVIDNGKARLGTDILHIAGYTNVNLLSAAGRLLMQLDGYTSPTERRAWETYPAGRDVSRRAAGVHADRRRGADPVDDAAREQGRDRVGTMGSEDASMRSADDAAASSRPRQSPAGIR